MRLPSKYKACSCAIHPHAPAPAPQEPRLRVPQGGPGTSHNLALCVERLLRCHAHCSALPGPQGSRSARANSQASFTPHIHSLLLSLIGRGRFRNRRHQPLSHRRKPAHIASCRQISGILSYYWNQELFPSLSAIINLAGILSS